MSGKCEHGLTTRECFTCASPKYGAHATAPLDAAILAQQVAYLTAERDALRADYEGACKLVADMHAAAMGAVVGPALGVVEDVAALRADAERYRWLQANYSGPPERLNAAIESLSADMNNAAPC